MAKTKLVEIDPTSIPAAVTRDQVERIACALLTSPYTNFATSPVQLVNAARDVASEINSRNFAPSINEQMSVEYLRDIFEGRKMRADFAENMSQAAAMAEKEFRGKSDG